MAIFASATRNAYTGIPSPGWTTHSTLYEGGEAFYLFSVVLTDSTDRSFDVTFTDGGVGDAYVMAMTTWRPPWSKVRNINRMAAGWNRNNEVPHLWAPDGALVISFRGAAQGDVYLLGDPHPAPYELVRYYQTTENDTRLRIEAFTTPRDMDIYAKAVGGTVDTPAATQVLVAVPEVAL